ncbi:MAG: outer rane autotransporter barrel domain protein, partial [Phycisphaerales bacterium]|nr:outer rane autotransporter barrel domain protein [Phycisphaerales bacterium]
QTVAGLQKTGTDAGTATVTNASATAATLTVNQAGNSTYSGTMSGAFSLVKDGAGTLTLAAGTKTYAGPTTITAGTLNVTGPLDGAGAMSIAGTLTGTSSVAGAATVAAGGRVNPGTAGTVGLLTLNGGLTATDAAATLAFDLGPATTAGTTYDAITITAPNVNVAVANGTVSVADVGGAEAGVAYHLIHWTGTVAPTLAGEQLSLPVGYAGALSVDPNNQYVDLTFSTVPEPASASVVGLVAVQGLLVRRRRRAHS